MRNRRGAIYAEPHYLMIIDRRLDSSKGQSQRGEGWHLWVDLALNMNPLFLSDELVARVKDAGMKMPRLSTKVAA